MDKRAAMALFLLIMPTTLAIAPIVLVGLGGVGIGGALAYYIFGLQQKVEELTDYLNYLNETLQNEHGIVKQTCEYIVNTELLSQNVSDLFIGDLIKQTEPYAWTLAKYVALKEIQNEIANGTDFDTALVRAKLEASSAVFDYYNTTITNYVLDFNTRNEKIYNALLTAYKSGHNALTADCLDGNGCPDWTRVIAMQYVDEYNNSVTLDVFWNPYSPIQDKSTYRVYINGVDEGGCGPDPVCKLAYGFIDVTLVNMSKTITIKPAAVMDVSGNKYFVIDYQRAIEVLKSYDSEYKQVNDNLDAYLTGLTNTIFSSFNVSDLLDPVTLATQINNDYETTGYYGFAAAELAMLGLNLTGLNKTVVIEINGTELRGILFTDWSGVLEVNKTYVADPSSLWYFIDENGQLYDVSGQNFTVKSLYDKNGNPLQNTTFVRYVDHSGDIQKIYDELSKLNELYQQYLEMQTVTGGGGSVGDWWAGLTDTQKILVVAAGVMILVLLARK